LFFDLAIIYLMVHIIRDLMQFVGMDNFITRAGHQLGLEISNKILGVVGLGYQRWTEGVWAIIEIIIIRKLIRLRKATFSLH